MKRKHTNNRQSYGIVGLGRFGSALALELAEEGAEILVLDRSEERVREMREYTENALVVQSLDKSTLADTGIQNCDVAVVCIGEEMDASILTVLHLKALGVARVIAKASTAEHGEILEKLGAEVVYPERDMAVRLAHRLENARVLDFVRLSEKISISKLLIPERFVGKTVIDVNVRGKYGLNIVAIENTGKVTDHVRPDYAFARGDVLYLCGSREGIEKMEDEMTSV